MRSRSEGYVATFGPTRTNGVRMCATPLASTSPDETSGRHTQTVPDSSQVKAARGAGSGGT